MERKFSDFIFKSYRKRHWINFVFRTLISTAALIAIIPLCSVFGYVLYNGISGLNASFFTELPKPVGELGGGMANAILGSCTLIFLASIVGVPWGIVTGLFLSEQKSETRLSNAVRFSADMLSSVPSIIIGLFIYAALVLTMKRFSAFAGGLSLGLLMIPTVARTTEELLKMVPLHIREAGLALGLPRWKVILWIILKGSRGPIFTGIMLALSRVAGETAPLLFTAFNNQFWQQSLDQPIASLPVQIYTFAVSPYEDWHRQAWAGALVLVLVVFAFNLTTRLALSQSRKGKKI